MARLLSGEEHWGCRPGAGGGDAVLGGHRHGWSSVPGTGTARAPCLMGTGTAPCPGPPAQRSPLSSRSQAAHGRTPQFGPRSETQRVTVTRCVLLHTPGAGQRFWQSIRRGYSLLAFVIMRKKSLKYKFKRQKWLLCMRSNCLSKKSQWDFIIIFFNYVPKYIFTE